MIQNTRLDQLLEHVTRNGSMSHAQLSALLNVHEDTIRRDIKILDEKGLLSAVRGGAKSNTPIPHQFRAREKHGIDQKKAAALKAIEFIKDGQVLFLDAGTSIQMLAEQLPKERKITVVTHSFPVVNVLENHPNVEIIFAGGRFSRQAFTTTGYETIQTFKNFHADICFYGICSIHPTLGLTTVSYEEALIKRTMMEMAKQNIALTTLDKLNTAEAFYISPVNNLDAIVSDAEPTHEFLTVYKELNIAIY